MGDQQVVVWFYCYTDNFIITLHMEHSLKSKFVFFSERSELKKTGIRRCPDKMAVDNSSRSACHHDNMTSSSDESSTFMSLRFIALVAALVAFNLVVIAGNSLVIAAVFTHRNLRTVTNTFIVSLAVADLLLGAVVLPFSSVNEVLGWWPFGRIWCSAWLAIDVWVCTASILNLCAISLDRYLAISRPFRYPLLMSPTRAKVAVAAVWTLALAICVPPLLGWRDSDVGNVAVATTEHAFDDVVHIDYSFDHTMKTVSHFTADGSGSATPSSTINDSNHWTADAYYNDAYGRQSSVETQGFSITKPSATNSVVTPKHSYSTPLTSSMFHGLTNVVYNKQETEFIRNSATTTSTDDFATNSAGRKANRIGRHSGSGVECDELKNGETADSSLVSDLPGDATPTIASFNCRPAIVPPQPVCMLTSEPGYIIYSACGSFWIPMLVMVFFYLKIYRTAVKATTALRSGVLTKKTGRIASRSEVAAVNLRVHRGGGAARSSGGYWTSTPNLLSSACNSSGHRTSRYGNSVDNDPDSDGSRHRKLRIHGTSTSGGNCFQRPSSETDISHHPTVISGPDANAADESCRHSVMSGPSGCCACSKTSPRISSSSQRKSTGKARAAGLSHRHTGLSTAANVDAESRRRRVEAGLSRDGDDRVTAAPVPGEGVECLVQSTLTPIFEQCSASGRRSSDGCSNLELVEASQAHARRRFFQIRTQLRRLNREKKAAKTVGVIVGCFVLCWAPFFTVYVLGVFCAGCTPPVVFVVFFWLGYCNSAINPFVYALCSKDFRFAFRRLLRCGRGTRRYASNSTIEALVTRLRSPAPRLVSQSANTTVTTAVSRRLHCQPSLTKSHVTTRC